MLALLRDCRDGHATVSEIDRAMALPGTTLVISQQNISRRVTAEEYREVLEAACAGRIAAPKPAGTGERAQKGVAGLTQDVAPSMLWGRDHLAQLDSSLSELERYPSMDGSIGLARKYLPEPVPLDPKLYVVMGGRAGAAAIENNLYFDVLISSWRASRGTSAPVTPRAVVEFFAHETHHLGYGQILDRRRSNLRLTPAENQVWSFLSSILMEGSATLLINGHEKLSDLEGQPDIRPYLSKAPELLRGMQKVMQAAFAGPLSDEAYAEATAPYLDMGYHATGAVLLAAIKKKRGLERVLRVMSDPRTLLNEYNACADKSTVRFRFNEYLAKRTSRMGEPR